MANHLGRSAAFAGRSRVLNHMVCERRSCNSLVRSARTTPRYIAQQRVEFLVPQIWAERGARPQFVAERGDADNDIAVGRAGLAELADPGAAAGALRHFLIEMPEHGHIGGKVAHPGKTGILLNDLALCDCTGIA